MTVTVPATPGAVIDIKLSEQAISHAGSLFAQTLGTSLDKLFGTPIYTLEAARNIGTLTAGGGFKVNIGNDVTVRVNGARQESQDLDASGQTIGLIDASSITLTNANRSTSTITGDINYTYMRNGSEVTPAPLLGILSSYQYNVIDASSGSVYGNTRTHIDGKLDLFTSFTADSTGYYQGYLTGSLSQVTFSASKLLKSETIKGNLDVSPSQLVTDPISISANSNEALTNPINVGVAGSLSSYDASYYDGSYIRLNSGTPVPASRETSLLKALSEGELWSGNDKISIILPGRMEQSININTGAGNDTVTAKGGGGELMIDTGAGDDQITLLDDQPSLRTGEGIDTLRASFNVVKMGSYSGLENVVISSKVAANIEGNTLDNQITGGYGSDTISGGEGNDVLNGLMGNDSLSGGFGDDQLFGGAGNDVLDGGEGINTLYGGAGNDVYFVDGGDSVIEERSPSDSADSGGIDEVRSWVNYTLSSRLEKLTLLGDVNLHGTGNALANTMIGNNGSNVLRGEAGNDLISGAAGDDHLYGGTGNDTLRGDEGNDILDGNEGADIMWGGSGDDVYIIDNARDRVSEAVSATDNSDAGGDDTVYSSFSFTLTDRLEHLIMRGENAISGTGNASANIITGNSGNNIINGKGGIDDLNGANGSDIYLIGQPDEHSAAEFGDKGFEGIDEVRFSPPASPVAPGTQPTVPKLTLFEGDFGIERVVIGTGTGKAAITTGKIAADIDASAVKNGLTLVGNNGANELTGTAFDDVLIGNGGMDTLTGGAGSDKFVFNTIPNAKSEVDTFMDFTHGEDQLVFVRSKFANIGPVGDLAESAFSSGAGLTKAQDADDRFIYDTSSNSLYFDRDGTGNSAAVLIGVMSPGTQFSASDFKIVDLI